MKDFAGRELAVGDKVIYATSSFSSIDSGVIQKLNPKTVRIGATVDGRWSTVRDPQRVYKMRDHTH